MKKWLWLVSAVLAAGVAGLSQAQDDKPVSGVFTKTATVTNEARLRIVRLKDRIKNQRDRIDRSLKSGTMTSDKVQLGRDVLNSVENEMKAEREANGATKTMSKEKYEAYNTSLDANSAALNEERQYFYYYGPYADYGPNYKYFYDAFPGTGAPITDVSELERAHPRIFELNARVKSQRDRIAQGVNENTLTADQAASCRVVLDSVEKQMKADYSANGLKKSMILTTAQYTGFNTSLDSNSQYIREQKQYFYYYGPYSNEYHF